MKKLFFLIVVFFISIDVNAGKSKTEKIPDTEKNIQLPNRVDVYGFEKTVVNGRNGQHVVSSHNLLMAYSIKNGDLKKGYVYLYLPKAVASKGFRPKYPSEKRPEFHVTNIATYREDYKRGDKDIQLDIARLGLNLQELEFDCSVDEDDEVEIQLQEISTGYDSYEFMSIDYELEFREDTGVGQLVTIFKVPVKTCSAETYSVCCFENMRGRYAFPDEELIAAEVFLDDQNKSAVKIEPSKSKKGISTAVTIHESLNPDFELWQDKELVQVFPVQSEAFCKERHCFDLSKWLNPKREDYFYGLRREEFKFEKELLVVVSDITGIHRSGFPAGSVKIKHFDEAGLTGYMTQGELRSGVQSSARITVNDKRPGLADFTERSDVIRKKTYEVLKVTAKDNPSEAGHDAEKGLKVALFDLENISDTLQVATIRLQEAFSCRTRVTSGGKTSTLSSEEQAKNARSKFLDRFDNKSKAENSEGSLNQEETQEENPWKFLKVHENLNSSEFIPAEKQFGFYEFNMRLEPQQQIEIKLNIRDDEKFRLQDGVKFKTKPEKKTGVYDIRTSSRW